MKKTSLIIILITLIFTSCKNNKSASIENSNDYSLAMAILYNYYSAEYQALTFQAFNIAKSKLNIIADSATTLSEYAVVVDIDETVLDNSPYQARAIIEDFTYPEGWNEWCNMSVARPVPGSLEFLNHADSLGYKIFYVSNRKKEFVYAGTFDNLKSLDFPQVEDKNILLRLEESPDNPDPSDKESRRDQIRNMGYRIIILAGDNLGDFYTDKASGRDRKEMVSSRMDDFGNTYIVLPNAMYGSWPSSIGLDGSRNRIDSLLREMSNLY